MALTAPELVAAAMKARAVDNPTDLAKAMGLGPWSPQKIKRWLRGENEPSYEATIALLEVAGWLNTAGAGEAGSHPGAPTDPQEAIAIALERLLEGQELALRALGVELTPGTSVDVARKQAPDAQDNPPK